MKGLERVPEPWRVDAHGDGTMVIRDTRGLELLRFKSSNERDRLDRAENILNASEALVLAKSIARIPILEERPPY